MDVDSTRFNPYQEFMKAQQQKALQSKKNLENMYRNYNKREMKPQQTEEETLLQRFRKPLIS